MRISFTKMHGLGNDFVVIDGQAQILPELSPAAVRNIADRHGGIGCDQLILLEASDKADSKMRIFNADGSEVEACGNAARAVAVLLGEKAALETAGGVIALTPAEGGASVDMGTPRFGWEEIPLQMPMNTNRMPVAWDGLENPAAVNVGNPHVIFFVENVADVPLSDLGPQIEHDPLFPERVNVNVASVKDRKTIELRVWERGAGLTKACGTGACATAAAAIRRGLTEKRVIVHLPGGALEIEQAGDGRLTMTGPATESFRGSFEWDDFA
ncbi:diaminopimelate epimerase [Qipengyuania atrilutea]|uniref:Diaminopimelate epimerase n=1 Tax=Qipengyuania atrilutea TaxID=2744473 RepID=A0A850H0Z7_9SPHN|nr:diaminopimelate epimerase [Actirhodobacter atriluteus]NVD43608.1 diaminopimelate epimerase [Actirhodobacter atriluteus]